MGEPNLANKTGNAEATSGKKLFPTLTDLVLLLAIYLYFTGFIYTYFFYDHFGISLNSTDIPLHYFLVYSYNVVVGRPCTIVIILVLAATISVIKMWLDRRLIAKDTTARFAFVLILNLVLALFLILIFPCLFTLSRGVAHKEAVALRMGVNVKRVSFVLKPEARRRYPKDILQANDSRVTVNQGQNEKPKLKLILETKDRIYALLQSPGEEELPYGTVLEIAKADIYLSTIRIQNTAKMEVAP